MSHPKLTVFARAVSRPTRPREAIAWEPELVVATAALHRLKLQTHVGCLLQVVETAPAMAETAAGAPNDNDHHLFFNGMLLRITTATTAAGVGATDAAVRSTADALLRWSGLLFDPAHIPTLTLTLAPRGGAAATIRRSHYYQVLLLDLHLRLYLPRARCLCRLLRGFGHTSRPHFNRDLSAAR